MGRQPPPGEGRHLLLYDGACGLCSRLVQFVLRWDRGRRFRFAPLQSGVGERVLERFGRNPRDLTTLFVVADYETPGARGFAKAKGVLFVAESLGWPLRACAVLRLLPTAALDRTYDLVARNRHRIPWGREACLVWAPEVRSRFLDTGLGHGERRTP